MIQVQHFNIMIVEDEMLLAKSLKRHIEETELGFKVVCTCENGLVALERLRTESIHAIFTDVMMPVMGGLELAQHVAEFHPDIKVIILSGYGEFSYAQSALKSHVMDYILKPLQQEQLESLLLQLKIELGNHYSLIDSGAACSYNTTELIDHVANYMHKHYGEIIDLSTISAQLGFSPAYLTKLFNRYKGLTPLKYLTDIRLTQAKHLLQTTDLSIREIGEKVGYPDQFHFSKTFRKIIGLSPSEFRHQPLE